MGYTEKFPNIKISINIFLRMFKVYYQITKPGIIYGNAITAIAGLLLAYSVSKVTFDTELFTSMLVGLSLVIGSGCVFNNMADRDMDAKMERTKKRAMVTGAISKRAAIIYGTVLGILGFIILFFFINLLTTLIALVGWIVYVLMYTPLKRRTVDATIIGSIAGATPPVVGYCAVTNKFDAGAIILFFMLVLWQMPHFYAIAIYRIKDYAEANIPVLPIKSGIKTTKIYMLLYIIAFIVSAIMLEIFKFTGYTYLTATIILGVIWLWIAAKGFSKIDNTLWAKKMFRFSLIVLTLLCVIISLNKVLP
jgi:protoheme IX farnesyltransferase